MWTFDTGNMACGDCEPSIQVMFFSRPLGRRFFFADLGRYIFVIFGRVLAMSGGFLYQIEVRFSEVVEKISRNISVYPWSPGKFDFWKIERGQGLAEFLKIMNIMVWATQRARFHWKKCWLCAAHYVWKNTWLVENVNVRYKWLVETVKDSSVRNKQYLSPAGGLPANRHARKFVTLGPFTQPYLWLYP